MDTNACAVFVSRTSGICIDRSTFINCSTTNDGDGLFVVGATGVSTLTDVCGCGNYAHGGSLCGLRSAPTVLSNIAVFNDRQITGGAIDGTETSAVEVLSANFTEIGSDGGPTAAVEISFGWVAVNFSLLTGCWGNAGASASTVGTLSSPSTFRETSWVNNSAAALGARDIGAPIELCLFDRTELGFVRGCSVRLTDCSFADEEVLPTGFTDAGGCSSNQKSTPELSLLVDLPLECARWTYPASPARSTEVEVPGQHVWMIVVPTVSAVALVSAIIMTILIVKEKKKKHGSYTILREALVLNRGSIDTFAAVKWDSGRDRRGLLSGFPWVIDTTCNRRASSPEQAPMVLAAFHKEFMLRVLLPMAAEGIKQAGEWAGVAEQGVRMAAELVSGVREDGDTEALRDNAIFAYTQDTFLYRGVNQLLRMNRGDPLSPLWPFATILQVALMRTHPKEVSGKLYRGAVMSECELANDAMTLRGFTSCSRLEARAVTFLSVAEPRAGQVRVMLEVELRGDRDLLLGGLWVGAAVNIRHRAGQFESEEEVVLLDGTQLKIVSVERETVSPFSPATGPYPVKCARVRAELDWEGTVDYFRMLSADE